MNASITVLQILELHLRIWRANHVCRFLAVAGLGKVCREKDRSPPAAGRGSASTTMKASDSNTRPAAPRAPSQLPRLRQPFAGMASRVQQLPSGIGARQHSAVRKSWCTDLFSAVAAEADLVAGGASKRARMIISGHRQACRPHATSDSHSQTCWRGTAYTYVGNISAPTVARRATASATAAALNRVDRAHAAATAAFPAARSLSATHASSTRPSPYLRLLCRACGRARCLTQRRPARPAVRAAGALGTCAAEARSWSSCGRRSGAD